MDEKDARRFHFKRKILNGEGYISWGISQKKSHIREERMWDKLFLLMFRLQQVLP